MKRITAKKLAVTALFMALTMVATMFIRIPLPLGYVNLGDAFVLLSVFVLGPVYGTIASGVGSGLADLFGYITYAPGTLIIKSAMAFVAWLAYQALIKTFKRKVFAEIIAGVLGVAVMAFGYFLYETLLFTTAGVALVNVPWNLLQGASGIVISIMLMRVLSATKILEKIK
jgi:uncharacterized membrane protein